MRYKQPKTQMGANGIYGGVGSRPGIEPWTPGRKAKRSKVEWVPARLRRLRLRRTRPRPVDSHRTMIWPAVLVLGLIVFVMLVRFGVVSL